MTSDWLRAPYFVKAALWSLFSDRTRTAALVISLCISVISIVFVANTLFSFSEKIEQVAFGPYRNAILFRANPLFYPAGSLSQNDYHELRTRVGGEIGGAAWYLSQATTISGSRSKQIELLGVTGDYLLEVDNPIIQGTAISLQEIESGDPVCLVGFRLADELDALEIGSSLNVNGIRCQVRGILGKSLSRPTRRFEASVIVPMPFAMRYAAREGDDSQDMSWSTLFWDADEDMLGAEMRTDVALRLMKGIPQNRPSPFLYGATGASVTEQKEQHQLIAKMLGVVAALCVVGSLMGFGALSAASVSARTREFAIRVTAGASALDIQKQVSMETLVISLGAGLVGLGLGTMMSWLAATIWAWPFLPSWRSGALALTFSMLIGGAAAALLAKRATELDPALATRR